MTIATTNPATGLVVQRFDPTPEAEIDRRIGLAARDFEVLRRVGYGQRAALKFLVMELFNGLVRLVRIGEFNEREAAGFAGHFVHHQIDRVNSASLGKIILKIIFHGLVGQVAYEEPGGIHNTMSLKKPRGGLHRQDH